MTIGVVEAFSREGTFSRSWFLLEMFHDTILRAEQNKLLVSQIKYYPPELWTYPFLVREGLGPQGPYSNYAYAGGLKFFTFPLVHYELRMRH